MEDGEYSEESSDEEAEEQRGEGEGGGGGRNGARARRCLCGILTRTYAGLSCFFASSACAPPPLSPLTPQRPAAELSPRAARRRLPIDEHSVLILQEFLAVTRGEAVTLLVEHGGNLEEALAARFETGDDGE